MVSLVVLLVCRDTMAKIPSDAMEVLRIEQHWLMGAAVLYGITFVSAWHFKGTFSIAATRMLVWAIVAYITMSHGLDVVAAYRSNAMSVLGFGNADIDAGVLSGVRLRLINLAAIIVMAVIAISVGFEPVDREEKG